MQLYEGPEWEYLHGKCYQLITEQKNWQEAQDHCKTLKAKLAEPQSPCESDLIHYFLQITRPRDADVGGYVWIGIKDIDTENTFVLASNDQPLKYEYWDPNEPNNWGDDEDCVHLNQRLSNGKWNDMKCSHKRAFICERRYYDNTYTY